MARFDIMETRDGTLLLDCQSDLLGNLGTRFAVPLVPVQDAPQPTIARLNPYFRVTERDVVMLTQYSGAVPVGECGSKVGSLIDEADRIMSAIDMLLTGY